MNMISISNVANKLKSQHIKYIEAMYHLRNPRLIKERKELMEEGEVTTDPFIEASPRYVSGKKFRNLNLPSSFIKLLEKLNEIGLDVYDPPYKHQAKALESFFSDKKDLIVSTGTGSGKTEIFLYSILGKLVEESERGASTNQRGIRCLILYPMNALVADQLARMRLMFGDEEGSNQIENTFGRRIQFGMYTSRTPYHGKYEKKRNNQQLSPIFDKYLNLKEQRPNLFKKLKQKGRIPAKDLEGFRNKGKRREKQYRTQPKDTELFTRHEMHSPNQYGGTPDILITNYSMLEYMLLRPIEQPLFDDTRKWLEKDKNNELTIVLDEAHLYRGAQGAEVSLLLRRLLQHLNINKSRVRFILTSATFGGDVDKIAPQFAAQLTSSDTSDFEVITGKKESLEGGRSGDEETAKAFRKLNHNININNIKKFAEERGWPELNESEHENLSKYIGKHLKNEPIFRLAHDELSTDIIPIEKLSKKLFPDIDSKLAEDATSNLMFLATEALRNNSDPLLPSKLHMFLKGLPKLYVCINQNCNGRRVKDTENKLLGRIFTNPKRTCPHCGSRVFELLSHRTCGAAYIKAFRKRGKCGSSEQFLWTDGENISDLEEIHLLVEEPRRSSGSSSDDVSLYNKTRSRYLDTSTGYLVRNSPKGEENRFMKVWVPSKDQKPSNPDYPWSWTRCPACGIKERRKKNGETNIMDLETKGEEIFANISREMFKLQPRDPDKEDLPNKGKKVLTFSDGRQKAARLARDLQKNVELDSFREVTVDIFDNLPNETPMNHFFSAFVVYCKKHHISFFDDEDRFVHQDGTTYKGSRTRFEELQKRLDKIVKRYDLDSISDIPKNELARDELCDRPHKYNSLLLRLLGHKNFSITATLVGYLRPLSEVIKSLKDKNENIDPTNLEQIILEILRYACEKRAFDKKIEDYERRKSRPGNYPRSNGEGLRPQKIIPEYVKNKFEEEIAEEEWETLKKSLFSQKPRLFYPSGDGKFVINPKNVTLEIKLDEEWYRCRECNRFTFTPLNGVCPYKECEGTLEELPEDDPHMKAKKSLFRDPAKEVIEDTHNPFTLRSEEHSAQLSSKDYKEPFSKTEKYELLFQDILVSEGTEKNVEQPIDVLSCTTTMEVGIDIGSLTGIAMRTVPPRPENYEQRSGRAGRRGVGLSTIITFADNSPHESFYFKNPELMIGEDASDPIIYGGNEKITERHVNASLIARFFDPTAIDETADVFESLGKSKDFFGDDGDYSFSSFRAWMEDEVFVEDSNIAKEVGNLLPSELGGEKTRKWRTQFVKTKGENLINKLKNLKQRTDWENTQEADDDLLKTLLDNALLPTFSFPVDLCKFVVKEIDENTGLPKTQYEMSRDLKQALSTYIPGRQLVVDKKTYTSYGVYIPFSDDPVNRASVVDWDDLEWLNFCPLCESFYEEHKQNLEGRECSVCEEENIKSIRMFEPPAFAPEVQPDKGAIEKEKWEEERVYAKPAKFPIPPTPEAKETPIDEAKEVGLCTVRKLSNQDLLVANLGPNEEGYDICRECGAVSREGELGSSHNRPYPRDNIRVDQEWPRKCSGSTVRATFGFEFPSDLTSLKVPIKSPLIFAPNAPWFDSASKTLAEALVLGASRALDIDATELKGGYRTLSSLESDNPEIKGYIEFFLFDTTSGGAGFASKTWDEFETVLEKTKEILENCDCSSSCHSCLQTFQNRHLHEKLNRFLAIPLLHYAENDEVWKLNSEKINKLNEQLFQAIRLLDDSIHFKQSERSKKVWVMTKGEKELRFSIRSCMRKSRAPSSSNIDEDISDYKLENSLPEVAIRLIKKLTRR